MTENRDRVFSIRTTARLLLFSLTMAFVEAAVVVYLRELYYPDGFRFPLVPIPAGIYLTELGREAATILMLLAVASLAAGRFLARFAVFSFCFGAWDIGYYFWLKVLLDWPRSLLDRDILFLIPVPWIAPVMAPVIVSVCLIAAALILDRRSDRLEPPGPGTWVAGSVGGALVILSFLTNTPILLKGEDPYRYHWWIFALGILLALFALHSWTRPRS